MTSLRYTIMACQQFPNIIKLYTIVPTNTPPNYYPTTLQTCPDKRPSGLPPTDHIHPRKTLFMRECTISFLFAEIIRRVPYPLPSPIVHLFVCVFARLLLQPTLSYISVFICIILFQFAIFEKSHFCLRRTRHSSVLSAYQEWHCVCFILIKHANIITSVLCQC